MKMIHEEKLKIEKGCIYGEICGFIQFLNGQDLKTFGRNLEIFRGNVYYLIKLKIFLQQKI